MTTILVDQTFLTTVKTTLALTIAIFTAASFTDNTQDNRRHEVRKSKPLGNTIDLRQADATEPSEVHRSLPEGLCRSNSFPTLVGMFHFKSGLLFCYQKHGASKLFPCRHARMSGRPPSYHHFPNTEE